MAKKNKDIEKLEDYDVQDKVYTGSLDELLEDADIENINKEEDDVDADKNNKTD